MTEGGRGEQPMGERAGHPGKKRKNPIQREDVGGELLGETKRILRDKWKKAVGKESGDWVR